MTRENPLPVSRATQTQKPSKTGSDVESVHEVDDFPVLCHWLACPREFCHEGNWCGAHNSLTYLHGIIFDNEPVTVTDGAVGVGETVELGFCVSWGKKFVYGQLSTFQSTGKECNLWVTVNWQVKGLSHWNTWMLHNAKHVGDDHDKVYH